MTESGTTDDLCIEDIIRVVQQDAAKDRRSIPIELALRLCDEVEELQTEVIEAEGYSDGIADLHAAEVATTRELRAEVERLRAENAELRGEPVISDHDRALYYAETGRLPDD